MSRSLAVVITGGAAAAGGSLARLFAADGHRVLLATRSSSAVPRAKDVTTVIHDLSSDHGASDLAADALHRLGRLDVWMNCAGRCHGHCYLRTAPPHRLAEELRSNALAGLLGTRAGLAAGAHVFNVLGGSGDSTPGFAGYGMAKAGMLHLTRSLRRELRGSPAPPGLHTIHPGDLADPLLLEDQQEDRPAAPWQHADAVAAELYPWMLRVVRGNTPAADLWLTGRRR